MRKYRPAFDMSTAHFTLLYTLDPSFLREEVPSKNAGVSLYVIIW
jgi:hypothetical protein